VPRGEQRALRRVPGREEQRERQQRIQRRALDEAEGGVPCPAFGGGGGRGAMSACVRA
jgi:hypothetical protein